MPRASKAKVKKRAPHSKRVPGAGNGGTIPPPEHRWKPGQSGNPGGRAKNDVFSEISKAVFENNREEIYDGIRRMFKKGNPKGLEVVGDRAYGKLTQKLDVTGLEGLPQALTDGLARKNKRK